MISAPGYESACLSSNPVLGSLLTPHTSVHPPFRNWSIDGYLGKPGEDQLWWPGCSSPLCPGAQSLHPPHAPGPMWGRWAPRPRVAIPYAIQHYLYFTDLNLIYAKHWSNFSRRFKFHLYIYARYSTRYYRVAFMYVVFHSSVQHFQVILYADHLSEFPRCVNFHCMVMHAFN